MWVLRSNLDPYVYAASASPTELSPQLLSSSSSLFFPWNSCHKVECWFPFGTAPSHAYPDSQLWVWVEVMKKWLPVFSSFVLQWTLRLLSLCHPELLFPFLCRVWTHLKKYIVSMNRVLASFWLRATLLWTDRARTLAYLPRSCEHAQDAPEFCPSGGWSWEGSSSHCCVSCCYKYNPSILPLGENGGSLGGFGVITKPNAENVHVTIMGARVKS